MPPYTVEQTLDYLQRDIQYLHKAHFSCKHRRSVAQISIPQACDYVILGGFDEIDINAIQISCLRLPSRTTPSKLPKCMPLDAGLVDRISSANETTIYIS